MKTRRNSHRPPPLRSSAAVLAAGLAAAASVPLAGGAPIEISQATNIAPTNLTSEDSYGINISISGNLAVVGAARGNGWAPDSGTAFIYAFDGSSWNELAMVYASDGAAFDRFGTSVSTDGSFVVAGAYLSDAPGFTDAGAAYVYASGISGWEETAQLLASDPAAGDNFGAAVAVLNGLILVGAPEDDDNGTFSSGSVYAFRYTPADGINPARWDQVAKLAPTATPGARFGTSIAVVGDTALIGAPFEGLGGAVYVYDTTTWTHTATLVASDAQSGAQFGFSIAVDGDLAAVGAQLDDNVATDAGAAYAFRFDGSAWTQEAKLEVAGAGPADYLGYSVGVSDGRILAGAYGTDSTFGLDTGAAHTFVRLGGVWTHELVLLPSETQSGSFFGYGVAAGEDALVGAWGQVPTGKNGGRYGAAYHYDLPPVPADNAPPVAVAGEDQSIRAGDAAFLDGSGSFDDNNDALQYAWSFAALPPTSQTQLENADTATPWFIADVAGTYEVQLIVTDGAGLPSAPDSVIVSSNNLAPVAVPGDDQLVIAGSQVQLDGSASYDPELDFLDYGWTLTTAPAGSAAVLTGADTATPTFTPDVEGVYEIALVVSDAIGPGDPVTLTVTATSAANYAEAALFDAGALLLSLDRNQVTNRGNQIVLGVFVYQAVAAIQRGNTDRAIFKISQAMRRTDGCVFNGSPDGNGFNRDWVTDCDAQQVLYADLNDALQALLQ